ncbi:MAG: hypothetical protein GY936_11270 [Ignavibacteriae bacterium]|nr:hypothetical protein [Ignavibacteriota bacterium]
MNFLDNLYVIENLADIAILKFGLFISLLLTLPFVSILFGSILFSLLNLNKDSAYSKFLAELVINKMWFRILFGVLPFFGIVFFYTQLYSNNIPSASGSLLSAFLLFVVGLCSSVMYKSKFSSDKQNSGSLFGWLGLVFTLLSIFILIGYVQALATSYSNITDSFWEIVFSSNAMIYFMLFISISFSVTSAVVLGKVNKYKSFEGYSNYWKEYALKTGIIFNFVQPFLLVLIVVSTPTSALSFSFFGTIVLALLLMLITSVQFYISYRDQDSNGTSIVLVFLLLISVLIYTGQISSENSQRKSTIKNKTQIEMFSFHQNTNLENTKNG